MNEKYILTPPASLQPRINGAKIVGARPNAPFLFKVPATGEGSLHYDAENLPAGLQIDPTTGIITGKVAEPGSYPVTVQVSNALGSAQRSLRIKIGAEICLTPPMGWNSWYCWSLSVSDQKIRRTAQAMQATGLQDHGYAYINIDDAWQGLRGGPLKAVQSNERFSDMKALTDDLHHMGFKAGIYSTPDMSTPGGFIGGTAPMADGSYDVCALPEDQHPQPTQIFGDCPLPYLRGMVARGPYWFADRDIQQFDEWGFDYVKYDWLTHNRITVEQLAESIRQCQRDIVYSLSCGVKFEVAPELNDLANVWRTTGDVTDTWESISTIGFEQDRWQHLSCPGHWNDPDMLQVGYFGIPNTFVEELRPTRLTPDEQYTQFSLWSLLSAPLLLSCDIERLDKFTLSLLNNDEVIDVDQDPLANPAQRIFQENRKEVWFKDLEDGSKAVGLFNRAESVQKVSVLWSELSLSGKQQVRDLWRQANLGAHVDGFANEVPPHGVVLVKLSESS